MRPVTRYLADDGTLHETAEAASARDGMVTLRRYRSQLVGAIAPLIPPTLDCQLADANAVADRLAIGVMQDPDLLGRIAAAAAAVRRPAPLLEVQAAAR